jgi:hypothetical protein
VDPVHGRARLIYGTIYTEPKTRCEILLIEDKASPFGAIYDPHRMGDAMAWHAGCDHCRHGRQEKLNLDLKRSLLILITRMENDGRHKYQIPSSIQPYTLWHWTEDNDHYADVECPDGRRLRASLPEDRPMKIVGEGRKQSLPLRRGLRLLFSARPAKPSEIAAVASFFTQSRDHQRGRRNACHKIDWSSIERTIAHDHLQNIA